MEWLRNSSKIMYPNGALFFVGSGEWMDTNELMPAKAAKSVSKNTRTVTGRQVRFNDPPCSISQIRQMSAKLNRFQCPFPHSVDRETVLCFYQWKRIIILRAIDTTSVYLFFEHPDKRQQEKRREKVWPREIGALWREGIISMKSDCCLVPSHFAHADFGQQIFPFKCMMDFGRCNTGISKILRR